MSSAAARRAHAHTLVAYAAAKTGRADPHPGPRCPGWPVRGAGKLRRPRDSPYREEPNAVDLGRAAAGADPVASTASVRTPEDVAGAALYLASGNSSWVTGVILDLNGGAIMAT
jgi:3-oxoacyl-[acyl-carrier protein] reductase